MAEIKTKVTDASVTEFIESFANTDQKKKDSYELIRIMQEYTGFEPRMWGPSIIGFGVYHYKSDRSKQEGDWPLVGFSPRKAAISLYIYMGDDQNLLSRLGKFTMGKSCIYVKKLSDIDVGVMKEMMGQTIKTLKKKFG